MSVVTVIEQQVRARLEELRPQHEEYLQLLNVLASFEPPTATPAPESPSRSRSRRRRPSAPAAGAGAGRRTGRRDEAEALVRSRPGITVSELAQELGIGSTYLYRIMPALEREGRVRKDGTGYVSAQS